MSSNKNGSGVEANKEKKRLEREDKDKRSPEDVLTEIQMKKTHNLYCPNCIHNITETANLFKKGEATFPYNEEKFIWWFVIVISFKYPFIYLPWLYNNPPDGSEPTQRVVDETPRKHVLDWLWLLLVVVLLLLSAIVIPDRQKIQEYVLETHGHLKPHVSDVVEGDRPILPSLPPPLPPYQPLTNGSLTILIPNPKCFSKDVTEIQDILKPHVPNVTGDDRPMPPSSAPLLPPPPPHTNGSLTIVEDDRPIPSSSPSLPPPLPLPPSQPYTNRSSTISILDHQKIPEDVQKIHSFMRPHVPDVVEEEKPILSSRPSPAQPPPPSHTNRRLTILIPDTHRIAEDVTEIHGRLKPYVTEVVEDDRPISSSSPSPPPSLPLAPSSPDTKRSSTILIPDRKKTTEDVREIRGYLKPHVPDVVEEDKPIPSSWPSPALPLPLSPSPPHTNRSSTVLIPDHQKIPEDVKEIHSFLKTHVPDVVKDDRPIPSSTPIQPPPLPPSPPHTNRSSTISVPDHQKISEDVKEIPSCLKPHAPDVVEEDKPIPTSRPSLAQPLPPPPTNGRLNFFIPDPHGILEDVIDIHGRLKPYVTDVVEDNGPISSSSPSPPPPQQLPPSPPHTNRSSTILILDHQKVTEDVKEISGCLKPHVPDVVEEDKPISSTPHKVSEDIIVTDGGQKQDVLDVVEDDRSIPPFHPPSLPLPHTSGSLKRLIPSTQKVSEDVRKIHGRLRPHVSDVVGDDRLMPSSPSLIKNKGGWIMYFQSTMALSVILLLLLAILAICLHSISWVKRTKSKNAVTNVEAQDSTNKPEDVTGAENKEGVASQDDDLSTTDHKTIGSATKTVTSPAMISAHVISPSMPSAKLPAILWQHITELNILKSIVYGGLVESIKSFGIVSSAAASGTSAFNVLALGLANLCSGLLLMIYNLYGLVMSEPFYQSANIDHMTAVKATDPYEELLGNRKKVILHCVVVVVSFFIFGVIPFLFYGLSFKITDNGHYEAAVVIAASLVCVISLSFAKAYAFGMDKVKTVAVYTGIAIGASALSFIASQYIRDLFEKYDFHKIASAY